MRTLRADEPKTVGDYQLVGGIGQGAMGSVYLGRSRGGRLVAVKVIRTGVAEDPQFRERFRREVDMARRVGGFWTAAVVDADASATPPWLATEYVPGPTLREAVVAHGPFPEPALRRLAAGLAEALTAVHAAGLVHRDLKPGNVLLAADGPRVIDFGIAHAVGGVGLTATGMFLGTPGYLSPEQISGAEVGPASDVFALGAILTYAATGHGPFGEGDTGALLYRAVHNDPDLTGVPASLRELVASCLHRDPSRRPTPAQVLARLGDQPVPAANWLPEPLRTLVARRQAEVPGVAPRVPTRQYTAVADAPAPAPSGTGATFRTSRGAGVTWGCVCLAGAIVTGRISGPSTAAFPLLRLTAFLACLLLLGNAIRLLVRAARPQMSLDLGRPGFRVRRGQRGTELAWADVARVRIVDETKRPWLVVWLRDGRPEPVPLGGNVFSRRHGGLLVYPIAHERPRLRRLREVGEMRAALAWYAPQVHDPAR